MVFSEGAKDPINHNWTERDFVQQKGDSYANRKAKHRLLVLDSCPVICEGLSILLDREADLSIGWHGQCYRDALHQIATCQLDLVITGLRIEKITIFDLIREIQCTDPKLPILVYGSHHGTVYEKLLFDVGICAYVRKSEPKDFLLTAIRSVLQGKVYGVLPKNEEENHVNFGNRFDILPLSVLAKRELEVFRLIGSGKTSREIATDMALSVKTVETYRSTIRRKLCLRNNIELIQSSFAWLHATMNY